MLSLPEEPLGLTFEYLFKPYVHIIKIFCFRFTASEVCNRSIHNHTTEPFFIFVVRHKHE